MPFNIGLFTSQQVRELKLIMLLKKQNTLRDYKNICQQLNCSFLTLQTEIATLQAFPEIKDVQYIYSHLKVQFEEQFGARKLYQSVILESNGLRLLEELFLSDFDSVDVLAEELFISLSTLKRLFKKTNTYLDAHYDFVIDIKELALSGDETSIRLFYLRYFSEAYDQHVWPFSGYLEEDLVDQLLEKSPLGQLAEQDFSLYHHLKILTAINLLRLQKGYRTGRFFDKSLDWFLGQDFAELENTLGLTLSAETLSEIFGDYLQEGLLFEETDIEEASQNKLTVALEALGHLEETFGLAITNQKQVAAMFHNALLLGPWDQHQAFLIYDYRQDYLDYFKSDYPKLYQEIEKRLKTVFEAYCHPFSDKDFEHLAYILLISWDNLFLHLSHQIKKHPLLIVERGSHNVGQFLQAYLGHFFEITLFKGHDLKTLDIERNFDLVLTDTILEEMTDVSVYYFSQLVPSLALSRLNKYLRENLQKEFQ
ncbi:transcriptional regulator [Streptococcus iniae]|uniref:helix-turn-helix domain-containing protein n=1 Tax=Streptococcus iniae TaxID=1346 RepID=UPI000EF83823|nr:helix-turn-helix domain-containing protein [Streptococcus iniae]RLV15165.1 transcriptional regulator [Streptococcus iniae]